MNEHENDLRTRPVRRTSGISVGGILAIIAVIAVAIVGYLLLRDTTPAVQDQTQEQTTELQEGFDAAEARARLNGLKSSIESDIDEEAVRQQYESIRADFEQAYEGASGEAAETWNDISAGLDELGDQIGEQSEEAVATIDQMLADFPRND